MPIVTLPATEDAGRPPGTATASSSQGVKQRPDPAAVAGPAVRGVRAWPGRRKRGYGTALAPCCGHGRKVASAATAGDKGPLDEVRDEAAGCRRCPLWRRATQTVFGAGAADADRAGRRTARRQGRRDGRALRRAGWPTAPQGLAESGLDRRRVYLTNAVKHFKWEPRGTRRLHEKPNSPPRSSPANCGWARAAGAGAAPGRHHGRDRGAIAAWTGRARDARSRHDDRRYQGAAGPDHRAPIVDPAGAGRRRAKGGVPRLRRRPAGRSPRTRSPLACDVTTVP